MRNPIGALAIIASALLMTSAIAEDTVPVGGRDTFSVLSWNVSEDAFARHPDTFRKILEWADAEIVVLDEVHPSADMADFIKLLPDTEDWNIHTGDSGGRQRQTIAYFGRLTPLPEFDGVIPYPRADRERLWATMTPSDRANRDWTMDDGIPVSGAVLDMHDRRLMVIAVDLQCCGDTPQSWQERRRHVEAREIRRRIRAALQREAVDGLIVAGDLNLVAGAFALSIIGGPYRAPVRGVTPAEAYHADGRSTWTWNGRGTPFPNGTLDFQLYSAASLRTNSGLILDTEQAAPDLLRQLGLSAGSMLKTGRHRPMQVSYTWTSAATP
ncbi:MAG: endonuclease/exonuclease/phosphatase family protein [Pseudomonadota bacterium]